MRCLTLFVIGCIGLATSGCGSNSPSGQGSNPATPNDGSTKSDEEKLQGTWTVVSCQEGGKPIAGMKGQKITIEGNRIAMSEGKEGATFKLDSSKSYRWIDLIPPGGANSVPGIYEINGDNLRLALAVYREIKYSQAGKPDKEEIIKGDRPIGFGGQLAQVFVLKRGDVEVKSDEEKYRKLIVGVWKWTGGSYPTFITSGWTEFTEDGKIKIKRDEKDQWQEHGKYEIKDDFIIATVQEPVAGGKKGPPEKNPVIQFKGREHKHFIDRLDQTGFETQYFQLKRVK